MSAPSLNIFTCANQPYEDFAPLFAASALWSNPDVSVEVGVENAGTFMAGPHGSAVRAIRERFSPGSVVIRDAAFNDSDGAPLRPTSVRFLTVPEVVSDYVYISDIDIITVVPDILQQHLRHMAQTGLPFSNRVRLPVPGSKYKQPKLTGLHFTRYDAMYPLPDYQSLPFRRMNDEILLYQLVEKKIGEFTVSHNNFRPVHGIHVSPNRSPYFWRKGGGTGRLRPGWLMSSRSHMPRWTLFRNSELFRAIEPFSSERIARILHELDNFDLKKSRELDAKFAKEEYDKLAQEQARSEAPGAIASASTSEQAAAVGRTSTLSWRAPVGPSGLTNL